MTTDIESWRRDLDNWTSKDIEDMKWLTINWNQSYFVGVPAFGDQKNPVVGKHAEAGAGVPDGLHGVLHLVETTLRAEDGGSGIVTSSHFVEKLSLLNKVENVMQRSWQSKIFAELVELCAWLAIADKPWTNVKHFPQSSKFNNNKQIHM